MKIDTHNSYMDLLINTIQDISDLEYQQKVWVEASIPGIVDSWEEAMCGFFDDANIDEFLKDLTPESNPQFGLSQRQIDALWKLRNILRKYSNDIYKELERNYEDYADPIRIINDPLWHKVVACAKVTMKEFEGYQVPPLSEISQA